MSDKPYSLNYLNEISGGDNDFVMEMIKTFVEKAPDDIKTIRKFVEAKNWEQAGADAHKFASSLLFLQLTDIKKIAIEIEESGIKGINTENIPQLLDSLETDCNHAITILKQDFNL